MSASSSAVRLRSRRRCTPSPTSTQPPAERGSFLERVSFIFGHVSLYPSVFGCSGPGWSLSPALGGRDTIAHMEHSRRVVMRSDADCFCYRELLNVANIGSRWLSKSLLPFFISHSSLFLSCMLYTAPLFFNTRTGCCFFERCAFCPLPSLVSRKSCLPRSFFCPFFHPGRRSLGRGRRTGGFFLLFITL